MNQRNQIILNALGEVQKSEKPGDIFAKFFDALEREMVDEGCKDPELRELLVGAENLIVTSNSD